MNIFSAIKPYVDIYASGEGRQRKIALWGMGRIGMALGDEFEEKGIPFEAFDAHKDGCQLPVVLQGQHERYFVIVTMMRGYEHVCTHLIALAFVKVVTICAWQSLPKFGALL